MAVNSGILYFIENLMINLNPVNTNRIIFTFKTLLFAVLGNVILGGAAPYIKRVWHFFCSLHGVL